MQQEFLASVLNCPKTDCDNVNTIVIITLWMFRTSPMKHMIAGIRAVADVTWISSTNSDALCNSLVISFTSSSLSSGIFSHLLNAMISIVRMSLPGTWVMYSYGSNNTYRSQNIIYDHIYIRHVRMSSFRCEYTQPNIAAQEVALAAMYCYARTWSSYLGLK